jgi:hypothetical protein
VVSSRGFDFRAYKLPNVDLSYMYLITKCCICRNQVPNPVSSPASRFSSGRMGCCGSNTKKVAPEPEGSKPIQLETKHKPTAHEAKFTPEEKATASVQANKKHDFSHIKKEWPQFDEDAVITKESQELCLKSWKKVLNAESKILAERKRGNRRNVVRLARC